MAPVYGSHPRRSSRCKCNEVSMIDFFGGDLALASTSPLLFVVVPVVVLWTIYKMLVPFIVLFIVIAYFLDQE